MKTLRDWIILGLIGTLLFSVGCGEESSNDTDANTFNPLANPTQPQNNNGFPPVINPGETPDGTTFLPNQAFSFQLTGRNGDSPRWESGALVGVDTLLKIRITAENSAQVNDPDFASYPINTACYSFRVGVKATDSDATPISTQTPILQANNGDVSQCQTYASGQQIETEYYYDFSGAITGQSGNFEIVVSDAKYDFYCQIYPNYFFWEFNPFYGWQWVNQFGPVNNVCPLKNVYDNHLVNGIIEVQTNQASN